MTQQRISQQTIAELRSAIRHWGRGQDSSDDVVSTGTPALDELFPGRGIPRGSLVEWLEAEEAGGAVTLSLAVGGQVVPRGWPMILIDPSRELSPLALKTLGMDLTRLVLVHPETEREALWVCEESLRCRGVGLVWMNFIGVSRTQGNGTSVRRLQLAAEEGGTIGFLLRPEAARRQPSWAKTRLLVQPVPSGGASWRLRVESVSSQGWPERSTSEILIDSMLGTIQDVSPIQSSSSVPVVSGLAHTVACGGAAGP